MTDQESQEDELLALASIFDSDVFFIEKGDIPSGHFAAHLTLPEDFCVTFSEQDNAKPHTIEYLPPVMLYFSLPLDYPSVSPPKFTLACKWLKLTQLSKICQQLDEIWSENKGEVILFLWTNFLTEELTDFLEISSPLDLSCVVSSKRTASKHKVQDSQIQDLPSKGAVGYSVDSDSGIFDTTPCDQESSQEVTIAEGSKQSECDSHQVIVCDSRAVQDISEQKLLQTAILEHDKSYKEFVFDRTAFTCLVCFMEKLGQLCIKFHGCGHVFCKGCMAEYFRVMIEEGSVGKLTCPSEDCESQAHPAQVHKLVGKELFQRYDRLLLQTSLDTMTDITYCPRKGCECAVIVDVENNMASCPRCDFNFCVFCKLTYHGISPCKLKPDEMKKLRHEYESATEQEKRLMEQRYGKKVIERAINDSYTSEWLEQFSKKCPHCKSHIQKIDGCNKMTCWKCHSCFCWICNSPLPRANPYGHFNTVGSKCFNQLFQGVVMDREEEDDEFFLAF